MSRFEIYFTFDSIDYKANVIRIGSGPVQYNIQEITPKTFEFPEAIILIWNYVEHKLDWGAYPALPVQFNYVVAGAIIEKLDELGISVSNY